MSNLQSAATNLREAPEINANLQKLIAKYVLLNVDHQLLVRQLVKLGFSMAVAIENVEAALAHPYIAAAREHAPKHTGKGEWFVNVLGGLARESSRWGQVERRANISSDEFYDRYYATNTPLVIENRLAGWPVMTTWTLDNLRERFGDRVIEVQGDRRRDPTYEINSDHHKKSMTLGEYIDLIRAGPANDYYMTANNFEHNKKVLAEMFDELGELPEFFDPAAPEAKCGMLWLGPAGTITQLHHDLTNNLMVQVVGRKMVKMISPLDTPKLYNYKHVYSRITDVDAPDIDHAVYPLFKEATIVPVPLNPGDVLFIPIGWWHHVRSLDVSMTLTHTNFRRRNDYYTSFPRE